ncbi:hypothetical protein JCM6882_009418 [Rhodosporidiobolus microsporus]
MHKHLELDPPPATWDASYEAPSACSGTLADFVRWNKEEWNPFIRAAYDDAEPFYRRRAEDYAEFLTDDALGRLAMDKRELDATLQLIEAESTGDNEDQFFAKMDRFNDLGVHCTTVVAHALREQLIGEDRVGRTYTRFFCPELCGPHQASSEALLDIIGDEIRLGKKVDFNVKRNSRFERLFDPDSELHSTRLPQSRGLRAFIESAYVSRHLCIAQFSLLVLRILDQIYLDDRDPLLVCTDPANCDKLRDLLRSLRVAPPRSQKPFSACGRCQSKVGRTVWFCGAECQKAAWPKHKVDCGKPFLEAGLIPSAGRLRQNNIDTRDISILYWQLRTPRSPWSMPTAETDTSDKGDDEECLYEEKGFLLKLPFFVRPYRPTLQALLRQRNNVFLNSKDDYPVGVVALYLRYCFSHAEGNGDATLEERVGEMARTFRLTVKELERAMSVAEAKLAVREDEEAKLIRSCFEQLKTGKSDPSFPPCKIRPAAVLSFDHFSVSDEVYYVWQRPRLLSYMTKLDSRPKEHPFPDFVEPRSATLNAIREVAYRGLMDDDRLAIGVYAHCVARSEVLTRVGELPIALIEQLTFDSLEQFFGFAPKEKGIVAKLRKEAVGQLEKLEGKEWDLVRGAIKQFEDKHEEMIASGALPPPPKDLQMRERPVKTKTKGRVGKRQVSRFEEVPKTSGA